MVNTILILIHKHVSVMLQKWRTTVKLRKTEKIGGSKNLGALQSATGYRLAHYRGTYVDNNLPMSLSSNAAISLTPTPVSK